MNLSKDKSLKIYIEGDLLLSTKIAFKSFVGDLTALFKKPHIVKEINSADIILKIEDLGHLEGYKYEIKDKIVLSGNDDLGLIYAMYAFLENELNVPPFYKMEAIKLNKIDSITLENKVVEEYPSKRFRGWFVNDEDILSDFKVSGRRKIDYEFYNYVIHPSMMKIICETALRHRLNLIIPSTFVDLMNKDEEKMVQVCSDMGLYISQHHIEPLGVSKFGVANYVKKHKLGNDAYSFISNRENLTLIWGEYAKKWSKFPRVIFQLGLRGGMDRPVWVGDKNVGSSPEERGKLISDAINTEYEIVKKYYKYPLYTTSTLWMEGAELYKGGYLKLPHDTVIILSDVGMSSLFGDDFFKIKRESDKKYGAYYHAAYVHTGPHLAEGVCPKKMQYSFNLMHEYNNDYYTVLNVANIKDLHFSIYVNSKLAFYNDVNMEEVYKKYVSFFASKNNDEFKAAIKKYFDNLGNLGDDNYKIFCEKYNFSYHKYKDLDFPVSNYNDGVFRSIHMSFFFEGREAQRTPYIKKMVEECYEGMKGVAGNFDDLTTYVNNNMLDCYKQHWVFQSKYIMHTYKSLIYLYDGCDLINSHDYDKARAQYELAKDEIRYILDYRKMYFTGHFKNWFRNDTKINLPHLIDHLEDEFIRAVELKKEGKI